MKKNSLIMLSSIITLIIFLDLNLNSAFSSSQQNLDKNVIPLLIPPYQMIKDINYTEYQNTNFTYIKTLQ